MALTILEGSTFCVSDELGDIVEPTMGFFADDTRFLSRWVLTRPPHMNIDEIVVKPLQQASQDQIVRH